MQKIVVNERALRELIREALSGNPVPVDNVVDPSATLTDPGNLNRKPDNTVELQTMLKTLTDDVPPEEIAATYDKVVNALKAPSKKDDEDVMKNKDTKIESLVREQVRKYLQEHKLFEAYPLSMGAPKKQKTFGPVIGDMPAVKKIPAGVHGGEYERRFEKTKRDLKQALKSTSAEDLQMVAPEEDDKRKFSTMSDVGGASFQEIADALGFSVAGAKQAVDKTLKKMQWLGRMQEESPEDYEILVLTTMNDYIKKLNKTGELTPADVELMRAHPNLVQELPGFREELGKAVRKARKAEGIEESSYRDAYDAIDDMGRGSELGPSCEYCGSDNTRSASDDSSSWKCKDCGRRF